MAYKLVTGRTIPPEFLTGKKPTKPPKIVKDARGMNKTEARYAAHLDYLKAVGAIKEWWFESNTLRLTDPTIIDGKKVPGVRYTPDFCIVEPTNKIAFHEVKGFWREDARLKIKMAADRYRLMYSFTAVRRVKGDWEFERF